MTRAETGQRTHKRRQAGADADDAPWRRCVWMGLSFETPPDWEIIRHSLKRRRGRLVFIDRRRQRLQVSWAECDRRPDLRQALDDYRNLDRQDDADCTFEDLRGAAPWQGYARIGPAAALTRLGRYLHKRRLWVEMTVSWPAGRDRQVERRLAEGFELAAEPPPEDLSADEAAALRPVRWRAFGVDVTAPPGWALVAADVKPADVTLRFRAAWDASLEAAVRRAGMVDAWYRGNSRAYILRQIGRATECRFREATYRGRKACRADSAEPATRFKRLTRRARTRRDLVYLDEPAHALMGITTWSRPGRAVEPDEFELSGVLLR